MKPKLYGAFSLITFCLTLPTMAADITWDSLGANDNWSTFENWSDDATPAGDDVIFNNTGGAAGTTVTNIVDTSYTIDSLNFRQTSASNQTMSISNGQTLTVTGSFTPASSEAIAVLFGPVTDPNNASGASTTTITGLGTFTVNNNAAHFLVGFVNDTSTTVTVDMSGLANFNATVDIFGVGRKGATTADRQQGGVLRLSKASSITATELSIGDTTKIDGATSADNNDGASTLHLGAGGSATTTINASTISMGIGKAVGNMQFNTGAVSSDKVTIRGTSGGSSAVTNWNMAYRNMSSSSGTPGSTVNFGVGEVDAIIGSLNIARWGATGAGNNISPSATFSTGTNANSSITVTTANIALNSTTNAPSSAQTMNGTLNVQGGVFSATTVNLATGSNTTNLTRTATLNVDGGTFRFGSFGTPVGGFAINFNNGTVASIDGTARTLGLAYNLGKAGGGTTVAFGQASGGTGTIALNGAGTLLGNTTVQTVQNTTFGGAVGGAFSLTKSGAATLTLTAANGYSGATEITDGTLAIGSGGSIANSTQIIVGATTTLDVSAVAFTLGASAAQTLSGTGTVNGNMTVGANGTLAIGTSPGTMTFNNNLGLNSGSISNFEINSLNYDLALAATAGSQAVDFGGGTLNLLFQSGFSTEGTVKIFDFDTYTGSGFASVVSTGLASGFTATFDPSNGIVTVIPEPRAALLGGLGMLALLRRRRD